MNRSGFTLVEVLIGATIFLGVLVASVGICNSAGHSLLTARGATGTLCEIRGEMERLRSASFEQLLSLNGQTFSDGKGKLEVAQLSPDLLSIKLRLSSVELYTMRSKN